MRPFIHILLAFFIVLGFGCSHKSAMYKRNLSLPKAYQELPIVDSFDDIGDHPGDTVRLQGTYRRFDWDLPNSEAFDGHALVYLTEGWVVMIERSQSEEANRPLEELKKLHNKRVEIVGKASLSISRDVHAASLNMGLVYDVQFIHRR